MILPIVVYGNPILKKQVSLVEQNYENLEELISNMFETMYNANGVGLAAPQIGLPISIFVVDTSPFFDEEDEQKAVKKVFINPEIIDFLGEDTPFNEGCLSIPEINETVIRKESVQVRYLDETFTEHVHTFDGIAARVIQHEYDHLLGKVFIDRLTALKRTLLKGKLNDISSGKKCPAYKVKPNKK